MLVEQPPALPGSANFYSIVDAHMNSFVLRQEANNMLQIGGKYMPAIGSVIRKQIWSLQQAVDIKLDGGYKLETDMMPGLNNPVMIFSVFRLLVILSWTWDLLPFFQGREE